MSEVAFSRRSASSAKQRSRRWSRAYTIVEVIIALSVLAVGGMGVVALEKFTVLGALNARGIASATAVADGWIGLLQSEAALWNDGANADYTDMPILGTALSAANRGTWITIPTLPASSLWEAPNTPPGGTPIYGDTSGNIFFCTQIRATWLGAAASGASADNALPTDVVRVDVRTFFAKNGRPITTECTAWLASDVTTLLATPNATLSDGAINRSRYEYGFVFTSGTVRRNSL